MFADFQSFDSPRGSRQKVGDGSDELWRAYHDSRPSSPTAESTYSIEKNLPEPPYHVFSRAQKKRMVYIVSLAGLFSPLSSNIYFPALGAVAKVRVLLSSLFYITDHK